MPIRESGLSVTVRRKAIKSHRDVSEIASGVNETEERRKRCFNMAKRAK